MAFVIRLHEWLFQTLNSNDENKRKVAKVFLQIIRKGPFIDLQDNFKGIKSNAYRPGPYAPVEDQVINFVDWCVKQLKNGLK